VELRLEDGRELFAQVTREECEALELEPGVPIFVRPRRVKVFAGAEFRES
jgi:hypothetical protein